MSQVSKECGGWQAGWWGQNKEDPSLTEGDRLTKECPQEKQGPRSVGEPVSGRAGGGTSVSPKDIWDPYTGPKAWAGTESMVRGRKQGSKRMRGNGTCWADLVMPFRR